MNYDELDGTVFDNHAAFNHYQSILGMRPSSTGNKPSLYITTVKLKRTLKELSNSDISQIIGKPEATDLYSERLREIITDKIENYLLEWQLIYALNVLIHTGRIEAITYVWSCKRSDVRPDHFPGSEFY